MVVLVGWEVVASAARRPMTGGMGVSAMSEQVVVVLKVGKEGMVGSHMPRGVASTPNAAQEGLLGFKDLNHQNGIRE